MDVATARSALRAISGKGVLMEAKHLDQFMRDFFRPDDEISVNCNWLQEQLRSRNNSNLHLENELKRAMYQIEILNSRVMSMEMDIPQYRLNIKG